MYHKKLAAFMSLIKVAFLLHKMLIGCTVTYHDNPKVSTHLGVQPELTIIIIIVGAAHLNKPHTMFHQYNLSKVKNNLQYHCVKYIKTAIYTPEKIKSIF